MKNLTEFTEAYVTPGSVVLDLTVEPSTIDQPSKFVIIRYGEYTMVLNPFALPDHLCVDAHAFVAGEDARTGVFGMEQGRRVTFPDTGAYSHNWPASRLVALVLGAQEEE
jgi:hypothetical protein